MSPFKIEVDQDALNEIVKWHIDDLLDEDLSGITWSLEQFCKRCCGGKSKDWVKMYILSPYMNEIDYQNGGWLVPTKGSGYKTIIFAKKAKEWMEKHQAEIDWRARL